MVNQTVWNQRYLCPRFQPCALANVVPIEPKGYRESIQLVGKERKPKEDGILKAHETPDQENNSLVSSPENSASKRPSHPERLHAKHPQSEQKAKNILDWLNVSRDGKKPLWENWGGRKQSSRSRAMFPTQEATGGFLRRLRFGDTAIQKDSDAPSSTQQNKVSGPSGSEEQFQNKNDSKKGTTKHSFPSWSTWKDWKKISIDLYLRLTDDPRNARVRLKQTLALLPIAKIKPIIDLGYRSPNQSPISMRLDFKILDCVKYIFQPDGKSILQVRTKAPLSDPRFVMDIIYERELKSSVDTVKIAFRALDIAFLKAPGFGFGFIFPLRFENGIKVTVGTKKYLGNITGSQHVLNRDPSLREENQHTRRRKPSKSVSGSLQTSSSSQRKPWFHIHGPNKIDVKIRCLEYR
ncbi:unnamed protein product [Agarophyton chilense]